MESCPPRPRARQDSPDPEAARLRGAVQALLDETGHRLSATQARTLDQLESTRQVLSTSTERIAVSRDMLARSAVLCGG